MLVQKKIKSVYLGDVKVRPTGWKPGENTIIYYPFTSNLVDVMGNGNTGVATGTVTFSEQGVHVTGTSGNRVNGLSNGIAGRSGPRTLSVWAKYDSINTSSSSNELLGNTSGYANRQSFKIESYSSIIHPSIHFGSSVIDYGFTADTKFHNIVFTFSGTVYTEYVDGVKKGISSTTTVPNNYPNMSIGDFKEYYSNRQADGTISQYIVESKVRTAEEIAKYYNQTKSNYGL